MRPSTQYTQEQYYHFSYTGNKATDIGSNKLKLKRVQRLINIKIAKAYRTVSNEALCALTGLTPS